MQRKFFEMRFFETYHFTAVVDSVIADPWGRLRALDAFWNDGYERFVQPFPSVTALHWLIEFIVMDQFVGASTPVEYLRNQPGTTTWIETGLQRYAIDHQPLAQWMSAGGVSRDDLTQDQVDAYLDELVLAGDVEELASNVVEEVFFHLFGNRSCLLAFNELMATMIIKDLGPDDVETEHALHFAAPGILRRVGLPEWVKHAVFYRDRGMCALCQRDLSRLIAVEPEENYDHIVPLSRGGMNDVTNIQLLCSPCNGEKGNAAASTSSRYERWF
jgi:hypothetical protein